MSHLITVVRQKGGRPTAMTDHRSDEAAVRQMCANMAGSAYAVALHSLTEDAVASIVARWENGKSKRNVQAAAIPAPSPATIEGEVETGISQDSTATRPDTPFSPPDFGAAQDESHHYEGRCMKCKTNREFVGIVKELANGSKAAMGTCPECGTKITRMVARSTPVDEWTDDTTPTFSDAEKAAVQNMSETLNGIAQDAVKPRKRTSKKEKLVKVTDAQVTEVQNLAVVECPECHTKQPIKPLPDGDSYIMAHPGGGRDNCRGSRRVVTPAEVAAQA